MAYESKIANAILVNPFDDKASVENWVHEKLTREEFFSQCYCHPIFTEESNFEDDRENEEYEKDICLAKDEYEDRIERLRVKYDTFLRWLNSIEGSTYTICGNAGTGKSTFINYLKYQDDKERNNREWIILDVSKAAGAVYWLGDYKTVIAEPRKPNWKIYEIILQKIYGLTFNEKDENTQGPSIEKIYQNLLKLDQAYVSYFSEKYPQGGLFYERLNGIVTEEIEHKKCVVNAAAMFVEYFEEQGTSIEDALNVLCLGIRCRDRDQNKKYIIVFDNFERFINEHEIFNKDVNEIRIRLSNFSKTINRELSIHRNVFKFIMSIRSSTERMCGVRLQAADNLPHNLNIGQWYNSDRIIQKKVEWYESQEKSTYESDLLCRILGDRQELQDGTITGLKTFIDLLFNHNKRLMIDFLGIIIESKANAKYLEKYRELWAEDRQVSRYAARSIVKGLILKYLNEKENLFIHLKTFSIRTVNKTSAKEEKKKRRNSTDFLNSTNVKKSFSDVVRDVWSGRIVAGEEVDAEEMHSQEAESGIGDARKILTILHNRQNEAGTRVVPLASVLEELYQTEDIVNNWMGVDSKSNIAKKDIVETLYYMNSYNRRVNDWIQFLDIQINGKNSSVDVPTTDDLEKIITSSMHQMTMHLMPAGIAYLYYIVATFDFFAVRYCKNYTPLFSAIPTPEEIQKVASVKQLPCYKLINTTTNYAQKCLERLRSEDNIALFSSKGNSNYYHSQRIRNQHQGYLKNFIFYLEDKYVGDENCVCPERYKQLINEIQSLMRERYK